MSEFLNIFKGGGRELFISQKSISHITYNVSLGVVACACNPATWRFDLVDGLRLGSLCWR